ncbi:mannan endo-1,4-beta-mannosidase 4-like [Pyrus ussuriensis x Pyrus communis]|uniref:Mannan endo-1,4-beta-mannosidase 4-like n=1 Tax=Pyrus ussuriensis x Pyrus communis TaxID=2448454 RepID=A0A5N5GHZ1_9ROSA|nr:mannan endo-1,4-beta-mannosidase 4-like [Pyrus ussuriensis x Pyrus communis]KAB2613176.1 mannan endo-1,4-beta-mannosidase 4-like [Pyrus ussuriensis x Pyrus communis]
MSKTITLCILAVLVCSVCIETVSAKSISYPVMRHDQPIHCRESSCLPPPSSRYRRGCEPEEWCRGGYKLK